MNTLQWAENEVTLACKFEKEHASEPGDEWYGVMCYKAALKLFKVFLSQGHSGLSASFTRQIFNRLVAGKPLTAIEDAEDQWKFVYHSETDGVDIYQHERLGSLFKNIDKDGKVTYSNTGRIEMKEIGEHATFHGWLPDEVKAKIPPITFPYIPPDAPYVVQTKTCLTDRKNGDFDTRCFVKFRAPDGTEYPINLCYAETENGWQKISGYEFQKRQILHNEREAREAHEQQKQREQI